MKPGEVAGSGGKRYGKPLGADYIKTLLSGKETSKPKPAKPDDTPIEKTLVMTDVIKPNPLQLPQVGYPQDGDKGDIWVQWVKQSRTGAAELVERWG